MGLERIPFLLPFYLVIADTGSSPRTAFLVSTGKIMILGRVLANVTTQHNTWDLRYYSSHPPKLKILETCLRCLYILARDLWGI